MSSLIRSPLSLQNKTYPSRPGSKRCSLFGECFPYDCYDSWATLTELVWNSNRKYHCVIIMTTDFVFAAISAIVAHHWKRSFSWSAGVDKFPTFDRYSHEMQIKASRRRINAWGIIVILFSWSILFVYHHKFLAPWPALHWTRRTAQYTEALPVAKKYREN